MTLVVDASFMVAALVDSGRAGQWARAHLEGQSVAAPHLMPAETANLLRRSVLRGDLSADAAALAHADLLARRLALFGYRRLGARIWELRGNVTAYDAWYVAVAEALDAPLATLDSRLARAPGPTCAFATPPT